MSTRGHEAAVIVAHSQPSAPALGRGPVIGEPAVAPGLIAAALRRVAAGAKR